MPRADNPWRLDGFGVRFACRQTDFVCAGVPGAAVLTGSNQLDTAFIHQVLQADVVEELEYLVAEFIPEFMCQTLLSVVTIDGTTAARGVDSFVDCCNNLGNRDLGSRARQGISTPWSAGAANQTVLAQAGKKLLQGGQGNILAPGNVCKCYRTRSGMEGKVEYRCDRITPFTCQFHEYLPD